MGTQLNFRIMASVTLWAASAVGFAIDTPAIHELKNEEVVAALSAQGNPADPQLVSKAQLTHWLDGYFSAVNRFGVSNVLGKRKNGLSTGLTPESVGKAVASKQGEEKQLFLESLLSDTDTRVEEHKRLIEQLKSIGIPDLNSGILREMDQLTQYGLWDLKFGRTKREEWVSQPDWEGMDYWAAGFFDGFLYSRGISWTEADTIALVETMVFSILRPWTNFSWDSAYKSLAQKVRIDMNANPKISLSVTAYRLMQKFDKQWVERRAMAEKLK